MKDLDFVIIGAQKCATTTLFELLRQHPKVNMPLEKEVPFFTDAEADWPAFARRYFGDADDRLWGKATPHYMGDPTVPARLGAAMPRVKLIAVLRDPIDRSRSHFRMAVRRQTETRDFDSAMRACLEKDALASARRGKAPAHQNGYESEAEFYLAWSVYGRILEAYLAHFRRDRLLVLFTDELECEPEQTLSRVLGFLDLPGERFEPRGLGKVMHAGGGRPRIPHGLRVWLRQQSLVARLWQRVPPQQQGRLRFLYERWNTRSQPGALPLSAATEAALREHFSRDLERLAALGLPCPAWADSYTPKRAGIDLHPATA